MNTGSALRSVGAVVALVASVAAGCDAPVEAGTYLRIELEPDATSGAAVVTVGNEMTTIGNPVCVRLGVTASLVLSRPPERDPAEPVNIVVMAFSALSGSTGVGEGESFGCPATLPPTQVSVQSLRTGFCAGASKRLSFRLGSTCSAAPCQADQTCGAGLDSSANACPFDACCPLTIADPCALLDVPEAP